MKSFFEFLEKIFDKRTLLFIIGVLLVVFSATTGIKSQSFNLSLDVTGRIVAGSLGVILIGFYLFKNDHCPLGKKTTIKNSFSLFTDKPFYVNSKKKNRRKMSCDFLFWDSCTIMIWVKIPPKGEGLRNSPSNRYIMGHHTGAVNIHDNHTKFYNQFCLRHNTKNKWSIAISNNQAQYSSPITLEDNLRVGWHHFFITWNTVDNVLKFVIRNKSGEVQAEDLFNNCFDFWVEKLNNTVTIGTWQGNYEGHYCETNLFNLIVYEDYLNENSKKFRSHIRNIPPNH
jgi:hypothetical protein